MKKFLIILLLLIISFILFSENAEIKVLPKTLEDFIALRDEIAKTPEGGLAVMLTALILYSQDEKLGLQCLTIAVSQERLMQGEVYKGFQLNHSDMRLIEKQLGKQKYIPRSYIKGANNDNDYVIPKENLVLELSTNKYSGSKESGLIKIFVKCSGADTPRPVTVKINDKGIWKAFEWSSLLVGIRKAKSEIKKDEL